MTEMIAYFVESYNIGKQEGYDILGNHSDILFQSFEYIIEPNTHQSECHAGQQFSLEICGPGHCWPHRHSAQSLGDVAAYCWRNLLEPDNRYLLCFLQKLLNPQQHIYLINCIDLSMLYNNQEWLINME